MTVSVPSYIIPGTYAENVRYLDKLPEVESIELLFYMFDQETHSLFSRELPEIGEYRQRFGFTVHMPDHIQPEHEVIIGMTRDFAVNYIIHPPPRGEDEFLSLAETWIDRYGERFLLENLYGRSFDTLLKALPQFRVCCDTGHLLLKGESPLDFMEKHRGRLREIHLHGLKEGQDHHAFEQDEEWFQRLGPFLRDFEGVCNCEIFCEDDFRTIYRGLESLLCV